MKRSVLGIVFMIVLGCSRRDSGSTRGTSSPQGEVKVWGALRAIMHEGRTGPQVALADAIAGSHAYGVGALSGLQGETTIVDGVAWVARVRKDGGVQVTNAPAGESATLLVVARVSEWRSVVIADDIGPDELDDRLEGIARANGIDVERPFPLLVEGELEGVEWHVLNGSKRSVGAGHDDHMRDATKGIIRAQSGLLVGFFSKQHEGVFTHMGRRTHLHVLTANHAIMGHADRAGIRAGGVLKLPVLTR
jgi:alpha-acetolactate decarboxylase